MTVTNESEATAQINTQAVAPATEETETQTQTTDQEVKETLLTPGQEEEVTESTDDANAAAEKTETLLTKDESGGNDDSEASKEEATPTEYGEFSFADGITPDNEMLSRFSAKAAEVGLSQEQAQAMLDAWGAETRLASEAMVVNHNDTVKTWENELKSDEEFGGAKFNDTVQRARRALKNFGSDDLRTFLRDSGLGSYPPIVKCLAGIDKCMAEDVAESGKPQNDVPMKGLADIWRRQQEKKLSTSPG